MLILSVVQDALVVLGLVIMTIGVYGVIRFPDVYTRLHAASKSVVFGVIVLLVASCLSGEPTIIFRSVLIAIFLLVTTPIAAHVIAQAAYYKRQPMKTPGAIDESGSDLPNETSSTNEG